MVYDRYEIARKIESVLNDASFGCRATAKYMAFTCHRYIQQQFFDLCLGFIQLCASNYRQGIFDARNERACRMSAKIMDALEKEDDFYPLDFTEELKQ